MLIAVKMYMCIQTKKVDIPKSLHVEDYLKLNILRTPPCTPKDSKQN